MPRRLRKSELKDAFSEFPAERPGLWPLRNPRGDTGDPLGEFETEVKPGDDRWLTVARGHKRSTPKVPPYRHLLAVASVVLTVFAPAGVISSFIVGRELAVSPLSALPPLPEGLLERSVDRLIGVPNMTLPSPPALSAESRLTEPPPLPTRPLPTRPPQVVAAAFTPVSAESAPMAVLPLTTALLSTPGSDVKLTSAPPPVRSNPPIAASVAPVTPAAPAPAPPPPNTSAEAAPAAGRPAVPTPATETAAVRVVLDRYRDAFSSLDASSAKTVWPAVDERMLERAFNQMTTQRFTFDSCSIDVTGARATASCRGRAQFVPKVGSRTPRVEPRLWTFTLRRAERDWAIESVDSR
jgi:hypothetical protein